ncbi:hypothetical protein Tco_0673804 [Tanacetum coccineum]
MAEGTMEELLRAPTEGYGEAIVLPEINGDHFEIKTNLLQLVQANPFHGGLFQNHASTSSTLPSNTILNPKGEMKAITTRSGVAYEGPSIPTNLSPKKVVERETEETTRKVRGYALLLMPRFSPTIKSLLMNKEKLLELAKIPLNENCSAMLLKKLPEKLGDPGKFLIPCEFPRNSIKMLNDTLQGKFIMKFIDEPALVCLPPSKDDNDEKEKQEVKNLAESTAKCQTRITPCLKSFKVICKDECLALGDDIEILLHLTRFRLLYTSVASILEGFIDDPPFKENDDLFDLECKTNDWKIILYDAPIDKSMCFNPGGDNDEINAFLALEVPTYIEEGYYDSEGDVLYLESLLSDENTHNLSSDVFFDHEPQHIKNESDHDTSITFSPKSDPLHHEFAGGVITIPPRIVRKHKDYISRMLLLCGNSSSRSSENFHTIIESLPTSTTLFEDSNSNREEIDIFSGPDDLIPPGIESDFDSEEDIIDNLLNDDPIPKYKRLTFDLEPDVPVINNVYELNKDECFDPGGGEINVEVDNSFTFVTQTFLPYLTYPKVSPLLSSTKNEDTIFDPGIVPFQFSFQEPVVVKCFMEFCSSTCFIPKDE